VGLLDGFSGFYDPSTSDPNSGGVAGSLLNPRMLPLLYAAAAAGQAATPSRLPVPLGSVMGQIAGGLGAGMQAGQQGLLSQQELYGRQTQNALNALTLRGYQRLQQDTGGNPPTAGGALAASMTPGGATSPVPGTSGVPVDPNAQPGADNSAFTADPNSPGAELRPALLGGLLVPHHQPPPGSYLANLASFESGGDPDATNPKSSAVGPFGFTKGTWDSVYGKYLAPRGFPNDPTDPTASAVAADAYARQNAVPLADALNRPPQDAELGLAHFLGAQGAVRMLQGNPDRPATDFASQQAVSANPAVFYRGDGTNRTVGEVRAIFTQKFGAGATALAGASSGTAQPSAPGSLLGGTQPQASAPQSQAAPLFSLPQLYSQYKTLIGIPGMAPVAQQILGLIQKGLPEGAVLLSDGSVAPRPGFNQFVMGKELSAKGYTQQQNGTWSLDPGVIAGEGATAGAKAYATLGPDVLKELSSRAGNPIRLGPNETVESGFAALPQPAQDAILRAIGGGGGVAPSGGASAPPPVTQPRPPVGGWTYGSTPSAGTGAPPSGGTSPAANAATTSTAGAPAPRGPQSFAVQNLFNASSDLPAPPRAQPFPTTPIRNPDGSITSPYSTSTIGLQEEANKAYGVAHDQFNAGQAIQQRLAMIDHGIDLLNQSGWSSTGVGAETKLEGLKAINSFLTTVGAPPVSNPEKIASFEDLMKETGNLGLDRARAMGSREAAQVVTLSIGLNPGVRNTPQGAKAIEASMGAAAQRDVDYYKYATQYAQQNGTTFGADVAFNQVRPPELYARRAIAATVPQVAISSLMNPPQGAPANLAAQFDSKYGRGMAAFILNGSLDGMPYASGSSGSGSAGGQGPQAPRFVGPGAPVPVQ
jgi:hypothetical protein